MSQINRPPPVSLERAASIEKLVRARFFAYNQKRSMPPRINPVGILLLILMAGIVFIGLTITIVSNWPGLASIGENRLKIAGPVILALGFLGFVITAIFMCVWVSRQNKEWERDMTEKAQKYISSQSQEPLVDDYAMNRMPGQHRMVINGNEINSQPREIKKTKVLPGETGSASFHDSSFDSYKGDSAIPAPLRVQKKRTSTQKGDLSSSYDNQSFSAGEGDMSIPGMTLGSPHGSIQPTNGFGVIKTGSRSPLYSNENGIERYKTKTTTTTTTTTTRKMEVKSDKGDAYSHGAVDPIRDAIQKGKEEYGKPSRNLRVLIKAKPGTAVHITPSSTPPTGGHPTRMSMDTEI